MTSIDRADWHYGGDYPRGLPNEGGGTHIGMYLAWIIINDLSGPHHSENSMSGILEVKNQEISGRDFLLEYCDGKFWAEDLSAEGLEFTKVYYLNSSNEKKPYGQYIIDYEKTLAGSLNSLYEVEDNWSNYEKISQVIDRRYINYQKLKNKGSIDKKLTKQTGFIASIKDWWKDL